MSAAGTLFWRALRTYEQGEQEARRRLLRARIRMQAKRVGATVDLHLPADIRLGRDIAVTISPGSHSVVRFGEGCMLGDRFLLNLRGGRLQVGDRLEIRRDVVINLDGDLQVGSDSIISWGCVLHVSNRVVLEDLTGLAERVTIADSSHYFTTPNEHFWHNVRKGEVRIGRNTWVCANAVAGRGADIGAHCIVAANTVVTGRVPDGHLASGVPATVRPLPLPWQPTSQDEVPSAR
jgi:acetyltransferase-like isoleucine patch superfamily enzyme